MRGSSPYRILLYHGVIPDDLDVSARNSSGKHVRASRFEREMQIVKDTHPVVSMGDIAAAHRGEIDLPADSVAVTFDDGYLNNYEVAWPILERFQVPATIYLATGYIGQTRAMWTDRIEAALLASSVPSVSIKTRDREYRFDISTLDLKMSMFAQIKALCKRLPNHVKDAAIEAVLAQLRVEGDLSHPLYAFMAWDQVREMSRSPLVTFGAHTVNHVSLVKVPEAEMQREIKLSLDDVSRELGAPCRFFSYPEGQASDYNETVISYLKSLGLDHAPSAIEGPNWSAETDPFHLRRFMVGFEGRPFPLLQETPRPNRSASVVSPSGPAPFALFGRDLASEIAVIAEIGVNHEGDREFGVRMIRAAADAGADAVKFQSYTAERFIAIDDAERHARVQKFALSEQDHRYLADVAKEVGIAFFSSAISEDWIPLIAELGSAIKIASADLTFEPAIRLAARQDRPLIISTGASTLDEVRRSVGWIREERAADGLAERLVVLHCVTQYPAKLEDANLMSIPLLRDELNTWVGWSHHVIGPEAAIAAVSLGACVLEVHVTDKREGKTFHDHLLSFEPDELRQLISTVRGIQKGLGRRIKMPTEDEMKTLRRLRKGIVAARELEAGEVLKLSDLMYARPALQFEAKDASSLVGRKLAKPLKRGQLLTREHLGGATSGLPGAS